MVVAGGLLGPASFLLPAGKALTGLLGTYWKGGEGLAMAVESKLSAIHREQEDARKLARSRMHVVVHLRPVSIQQVPLDGGSGAGADADGGARTSFLARLLGKGGAREKHPSCAEFVDRYWCHPKSRLTGDQLSPDGNAIPAGLKAFQLNVVYDILRSAAQSGGFEVDWSGARVVRHRQQQTDTGDMLAVGGSQPMDAEQQTTERLPAVAGLSEAMEYTNHVRLRAEILCLRGEQCMFASYHDTGFTPSDMLSGIQLQTVGKADDSNPYCKFVRESTETILAQCEILSAADLEAKTATTGSSVTDLSSEAAPGSLSRVNTDIAQCFQSFSRIRDITRIAPSSVTATLLPWLGYAKNDKEKFM